MISNSIAPTGGSRSIAAPPGWTDLNTILKSLMSDCPATHIRCETLPPAAGRQEEWWMLLRWLMQPVRQDAGDPRYVHVQCNEVIDGREQRHRITVRCSGLPGFVRACSFNNAQLSGIAARLGIRLAQPPLTDAHCLFILEYPGKKTLHAHH